MTTGQKVTEFLEYAPSQSSIAASMKSLYDGLKASTTAHICLGTTVVDVRLPPHLSALLSSEEDAADDDEDHVVMDDDDLGGDAWGDELGLGWKLPVLAPWKALLLLETADGQELDPDSLKGPHISGKNKTTADGLVSFLKLASVTCS